MSRIEIDVDTALLYAILVALVFSYIALQDTRKYTREIRNEVAPPDPGRTGVSYGATFGAGPTAEQIHYGDENDEEEEEEEPQDTDDGHEVTDD